MHVIVKIIGYKPGEFHSKEQQIKYKLPKIKYCLIGFDMDGINEDSSRNSIDKNIILHQLKPFKQYIY